MLHPDSRMDLLPTPQDLEDHPPFVMAARLKPKTSHDKPKLHASSLPFTHSHFVPWRARSSFTSSSRPQAIHPRAARHRPGVAPQRPGLRRAAGADRHRLAATNNAPLPAPGMEWGPGNRPPEADPNPTCAMGRTSRPPAAAYVQYRGTKPTAHPCVVAHRHR